MKGYIKLRKKALDMLQKGLPKYLSYHGIQHTLKALRVCEQYIKYEKIDKYQAQLLRIGILMHDIGFTESEVEHESEGVIIARSLMLEFGFSSKDFILVKGLIMATKLPQNPKNKLEEIIADVDLDYLGRKDFYEVSDLLFDELKNTTLLSDKNEWNKMQITFLETHQFHTDFARKNRKPLKERRIVELKNKILIQNVNYLKA